MKQLHYTATGVFLASSANAVGIFFRREALLRSKADEAKARLPSGLPAPAPMPWRNFNYSPAPSHVAAGKRQRFKKGYLP